jgi:hypothetical protein
MKYHRIFIYATEVVCVVILALCAVTAFSNSALYAGFVKLFSKSVPAVYLSLLIFLVIMACGVFFIVLRSKGSGILTTIVTILCLPSIFSFNNIDLFKIFGSAASVTTKLTLVQMISIGSLIISVYFLLDLMHQLKLNTQRFKESEAQASDIQDVLKHQHLLAIILVGAALLFSLIITLAARGFEYLLTRNAWSWSWWIIPMALFCIAVLAVYLYWITTRKNTE